MKNVSESDLLKACRAFVAHIESLPDDTQKCRHLKMCLNSRAGELLIDLITRAELKGE